MDGPYKVWVYLYLQLIAAACANMVFLNHAPSNLHPVAAIVKNGFGPVMTGLSSPFSRSSKTSYSLELRNPTFPEPTPPPSGFLKDEPMCRLVGAALGICNSLSPGFATLDLTRQAQCLCYSSTAWAPDIFDGAIDQCANYASTAAPEVYYPLAVMGSFCERIGDVEGPKSTSVTTTSTSGAPLQPSPGCAAASSLVAECAARTIRFEDLAPAQQAKCLCYDIASTWNPSLLNDAVSTCEGNVENQSRPVDLTLLNFYSRITPILSACVSLGNFSIINMTTPAPTTLSTLTTSIPPINDSSMPSVMQGTGATSGAPIDTTSTMRPTKTQIPIEISKGNSIGKVEIANVVGISFCCAFVLFFLC